MNGRVYSTVMRLMALLTLCCACHSAGEPGPTSVFFNGRQCGELWIGDERTRHVPADPGWEQVSMVNHLSADGCVKLMRALAPSQSVKDADGRCRVLLSPDSDTVHAQAICEAAGFEWVGEIPRETEAVGFACQTASW